MTREIIEGIQTIEREKGIESGTLIEALEDALLAAYKKTPAPRAATVELDQDTGDFRVFSIDLPGDIEERLVEEARERAIGGARAAGGRDGREVPRARHRRGPHDRPHGRPRGRHRARGRHARDFGRIAAQTAKQVILQRIREAEREMMYEEYIDRVTEVVTGIVQQAGDRNNVLIDLGKVEALLPRSGAGGRRALRAGEPHQGGHHRGAVRDEGPAGHPLAAGTRS